MMTIDREPTLRIVKTPGTAVVNGEARPLVHDAARPFVLLSVTVAPGRRTQSKVLGRYTSEAGALRAARRRDETI